MEEPNGSRPDGSFEDRLAKVRARREAREQNARRKANAALGIGFRLSLELVVAVIVGSLFGFGLDRWLGTTPWLMVVFFMVGAAAGVKNMLRAVKEMSVSEKENDTVEEQNEPRDN